MPETMTVYKEGYDHVRRRSDELGALEAGTHPTKEVVCKDLHKHLLERNTDFGHLLCGEHETLVCIDQSVYDSLRHTEEWYNHLCAYGIDNSEAYQQACEDWDGD